MRLAHAEGLERDAEGSGHDAERFHDAEDARGGDGAHADEADVAAEDLRRGHLRDGDGAGVDGVVLWLPIIQIRGTRTRLESTPPAQRIMELRRPMT